MASAASSTVLITGANRGIGLALAELYAKRGARVVATARDPAKAVELNAIAKANTHVSVVALDTSDSKSVAALPAALKALSPSVAHIDLLVNNAAVMNGAGTGVRAFATLTEETPDDFAAVFRTNVIGVYDVTHTLLPLLRAAAARATAKAAPKVLNISSAAGSTTITNAMPIAGLAGAYRVSKAALNQLTAVQAREYNADALAAAAPAAGDAKAGASAAAPKGVITFVAVHPGAVETSAAAAAPAALRGDMKTTAQSADAIAKLADVTGVSATAAFVDAFTQQPMPW